MGKTEIRNICPVSLETPADKQPQLHNRWHPDIPFAGSIKNGETVKIECVSGVHERIRVPPLTGLLGRLDWWPDRYGSSILWFFSALLERLRAISIQFFQGSQ